MTATRPHAPLPRGGAGLDRHHHQPPQLHRHRGPEAERTALTAGPAASAPRPARREKPSVDRRARRSTLGMAATTGLLVAAATAAGLFTGPMRFDDEGTYVSQALSVLDGSLAPYTYWYDHPPLGWILLGGWMGGPGSVLGAPNPVAAGRQAMVLVVFASTVFLVVTMRRLGAGRVAAVGAGLAFGLSPLAMHYHRMVLLDNIGVCFLLMAWMFAVARSRTLASLALSGFALSLAVLSKETLLLQVPFVAWMAWRSYSGPTRKFCLGVFAITFSIPLALYPLFALLRGELLPGEGHVSLWDAMTFQLAGRQGSGSVFDPASDARAVLSGWLESDGTLLVAGALLLAPAMARRRAWPVGAAAAFGAAMLARPGYLPVPYVVVLIPLAAMLAALGLESLCQAVSRPARVALQAGGPAMPGWRRVAAVSGAVALAGAAVAAPGAARQWWERDLVFAQHDFDAPYRLSSGWVLANVPRDAVIVVDNVTWTDVAGVDGRDPSRAVWFTKLGKDPEVDRAVRSWRDVDYIVESEIMRIATPSTTLRDATSRGVVVRTWGEGPQRIVVRRVES